jgi:hypothetical protein
MRINHKLLSIPPYISTSWKNIASLHVEASEDEETLLIITLLNGTDIEVPHLDMPIIEAIFAAHARFMDQDSGATEPKLSFPRKAIQNMQPSASDQALSFGFPLRINADNVEKFGGIVQHNAEQMDHPDLPQEVLKKIAAISKVIGATDPDLIPKPEPHCNCPHCQISRAIHEELSEEGLMEVSEEAEELVSAEDLSFRSWDVDQTSDKLFIVSNPLDTDEHYNVYLGEPIGCTCGQNNCEHIKAVLKT